MYTKNWNNESESLHSIFEIPMIMVFHNIGSGQEWYEL